MAQSRKTSTRKKKATTTKEKSLRTKIIPVLGKDKKPVYANHLNLSHSKNEFVLAFCNIQPMILPLEDRKELEEKNELIIEPEVAVVVPVQLVPNIIETMLGNYVRYLDTYRDEIKLSDSDEELLKDLDIMKKAKK